MHLTLKQPEKIVPCLHLDELRLLQEEVQRVHVSEAVIQYIIKLSEKVRQKNPYESNISIRASIDLTRAAQATALLAGRNTAYPDDVKYVFAACYAHRLEFTKSTGNAITFLKTISSFENK